MTTLWLDLGNTRLKYWLTDNNNSILDHDAKLHLQAPAELLMGLSDKFIRLNPDFIGISSVLGQKINQQIIKTLTHTQIPFEFAKVSHQNSLLQSHYQSTQLGVDRWLQMLGASQIGQNLCVVGCGTAMTVDIIHDGVHLGGFIFANARLQREALYAGTRQIDVTDGDLASLELATNTTDAVNHGILLSITGAINQVLRQYPTHQLVMTGGDAKRIAQHLFTNAIIEKNLLLIGLQKYFNLTKN